MLVNTMHDSFDKVVLQTMMDTIILFWKIQKDIVLIVVVDKEVYYNELWALEFEYALEMIEQGFLVHLFIIY